MNKYYKNRQEKDHRIHKYVVKENKKKKKEIDKDCKVKKRGGGRKKAYIISLFYKHLLLITGE